MARTFIPHTITDDSAIGGQVIQGSTIFDSVSASHLKRTPSSVGNRRTFTISFWFKATLSSSSTQWIWQKSQSATNNNFGVYVWTSGSTNYVTLWDDIDNRQSAPFLAEINSNQWYNIVVTMESLLCKMYLNGSSVPVYSGRSATSSDNFASITAGGTPCNLRVPDKSMKASSSDKGSTKGVISFIISRICWLIAA